MSLHSAGRRISRFIHSPPPYCNVRAAPNRTFYQPQSWQSRIRYQSQLPIQSPPPVIVKFPWKVTTQLLLACCTGSFLGASIYAIFIEDRKDYLEHPEYGTLRECEAAIDALHSVFASREIVSTDPRVLKSHGFSTMNSYHAGKFHDNMVLCLNADRFRPSTQCCGERTSISPFRMIQCPVYLLGFR